MSHRLKPLSLELLQLYRFHQRHRYRQQQELKDLDFLDDLDEITKSLIAFENEHHEIHNAIGSEIGEALIGKNIHDDSIYDDENSAIINGYYDAEDLEITFHDINHYGSGHIGMSCSLKILQATLLTFLILKSVSNIAIPSEIL